MSGNTHLLIAEAMPYIAHTQIRNRGTLGGSLAHADPAAELPAIVVALEAQLRVQNSGGERTVSAADFFLGLFTTALEPDELLVEVTIPPLPARTGTAFEEFARRHGDYALAGACVTVTVADNGKIDTARLVLFSVGDAPLLASSVSDALVGVDPTQEAIQTAVEAVDADIEPQADIHATAEYRRHLVKVLARRVLVKAVERAMRTTEERTA